MSVSFLAVGKENHTGRYLFSVKKSETGSNVSPGTGAGVYLDTCVAILSVESETRFWLFWLAPDATGKVKGHTVSGDKLADEHNVLEGFHRDLREAKFNRLYTAQSFQEAEDILVNKIHTTIPAAQNILEYLKNN